MISKIVDEKNRPMPTLTITEARAQDLPEIGTIAKED